MNFTCFNPQNPLIPDPNVKSKLYCDNSIPKNYYPRKLITYLLMTNKHDRKEQMFYDKKDVMITCF